MCRIGPLMKNLKYEVSAEKEGYVLEKEAGEMAVFRALKLGKIAVKVYKYFLLCFLENNYQKCCFPQLMSSPTLLLFSSVKQ